jgi:hypothetical protein
MKTYFDAVRGKVLLFIDTPIWSDEPDGRISLHREDVTEKVERVVVDKYFDNIENFIFAYTDGGDQESRLTSIRKAKIALLRENIKEDEKGYIRDISDISDVTIGITKLITISNEFYDSDNLKRNEMIDGKNKEDLIHGFKFSEPSILEKSNITFIVLRENVDGKYLDFQDHVYYVRGSYNEILSELRGVNINPIGKLDNMYWDTSLIPEDDGNIDIYKKYLDENEKFKKVKGVAFYDSLNSEWYI